VERRGWEALLGVTPAAFQQLPTIFSSIRICDFYRTENVCFSIDTPQHLDAALPDKIKPLRQAVLNDLWYVLASLAKIENGGVDIA
jgi:hypothetical protein